MMSAEDSFELDQEGLNEALDHLSNMGEILELDPLHMKNADHLTPEERYLSNAYYR